MKNQDLPVLELEGKYNGTEERSILVRGFEHRSIVEKLCKEFNQECYLESHNDRSTALVYPDGHRESLGTLIPVSRSEAEAVGSWSYNPEVRQYFITK